MQLDSTRIAIRERGFPEILDLSLRVIRVHGLPLLAVLAIGAIPLQLINYLLLSGLLASVEVDVETPGWYLYLVRGVGDLGVALGHGAHDAIPWRGLVRGEACGRGDCAEMARVAAAVDPVPSHTARTPDTACCDLVRPIRAVAVLE